jgi:L-asparagine oxygenase
MHNRRGSGLVNSHDIDPVTRATLHHRLEAVAGSDAGTDERFIDDSFAAVFSALPRSIVLALIELRQADSVGALVVTNLPIDTNPPPTPTVSSLRLRNMLPVARATLLGVTRILGEPFGYAGEWQGDIVSHVLPSRSNADSQSSQGSRLPLLFHTENVHLWPYSPDYVALLGVRPDPRRVARTTLVHAQEAVALLPTDVVDTLRLALYHTRAPVSFGRRGTSSGPLPVLQGPRSQPQITVDLMDTTGLTGDARRALAALIDAASSVATSVELDAGHLLIIDNRRVLHGRTAFEPRLDGTDRWCLRTMIRAGDLWAWRVHVDGRTLVF